MSSPSKDIQAVSLQASPLGIFHELKVDSHTSFAPGARVEGSRGSHRFVRGVVKGVFKKLQYGTLNSTEEMKSSAKQCEEGEGKC